MDLDFTPDQSDLREGIRGVLERECPPALVRALAETGDRGAVERLWEQMVALDWPALTVPEEHGGIGLGAVELAILAEEAGRVVAPGPLLATASQFVPAVREVGGEASGRWLAAVATWETSGTLALAEGGRFTLDAVTATVDRTGDHVVVDGVKEYVAEAGAVDEIAVAARIPGTEGDDGLVVVVVPAAACGVEPIHTLDPTRQYARVVLDSVVVGADRLLGADGSAARGLARAIEEATMAAAMETVGACQAILDMTVAYARERVQFGRPIGSFQAVKHKAADMLVALERARATGLFAAACIAEDDERRGLAVSVAKAAAGDAQRVVVQEGIQLHGGIGYTWEHNLHLFAKRAKSGDAVWGTARHHRARLAQSLTAAAEDAGPVARWSDGR